MRNMRIIIYSTDSAETQFYETLCRSLSANHNIPIELKLYTSSSNLVFDSEDFNFHQRVDVVYVCLSKSDQDVPALIRKAGYMGLIVLIGTDEMFVPYEQLFDTKIYNFVQNNRAPEHLERFEQIFQEAGSDVNKKRCERVTFSFGGEIRQIDISQIHYFEVQKHLLVVHFEDKETFTFISSLAKMENHLKGRGFVRVSRFYLISIHSVQKLTGNGAIMRNGVTVPIGRKYYATIKSLIGKR